MSNGVKARNEFARQWGKMQPRPAHDYAKKRNSAPLNNGIAVVPENGDNGHYSLNSAGRGVRL